MKNIDDLILKIKNTVDSHCLGTEGEYARWIWQDENGTRNLNINEYGCADAANILYTINCFIKEPQKRSCWVKALQSLQDSKTGLFKEPTHHFIHTTAHCIAALELFDASPIYPLTDLMKYTTKKGLYDLLKGLDWNKAPWPESHKGAGIYAALTLTDTVGTDWATWYFDWLRNETDPETGMWRKGFVRNSSVPVFNSMAGSFHYLFNHEYAKMPLQYPEKLIDTCIELYDNKLIREDFGKCIGFLEIDWVYCITRSGRQTSYRFDDCKKRLKNFCNEYLEYLFSIDTQTDDGWNDLHMLFGSCCALAELQQALPGSLQTKKPLRLVLDRRPFI